MMKYYIPYIYSARDLGIVGHGYVIMMFAEELSTEAQLNEVMASINQQISFPGDYVVTILDWKRIF